MGAPADPATTAGLSHRRIVALAWPIILANVATPLLGLADTAVIGNLGSVQDLGAIALGSLLFSFLYWSFGFLRMGTTGFTAQAVGAGDEAEVRAVLGRALLIAVAAGAGLVALQQPIGRLAWWLFDASADVETTAARYFAIRIWSAPAALALYAVMGSLIGLGDSRALLRIQLLLNGVNIALDLWFAGVLQWGAQGVALGTALAEWIAVVVAMRMLVQRLRQRRRDAAPLWPAARIFDPQAVRRMIAVNGDIMLRTLAMLLAFAWFTNQSAAFGDAVLGANHLLLQLLTFSAFFLDGYAFAAESLVGQAVGSRDAARFDAVVRKSSQLAVITAVLLAALLALAGREAIDALTRLAAVRGSALADLPWCALYVLLSAAAFQLDGIFVGATRTRDMRNASLLSAGVFVAAGWYLVRVDGNRGLWIAFNGYVVLRALSLLRTYPALRRSVVAAGG